MQDISSDKDFLNFLFVCILDGFYFYIFTFTNLNLFSYNWLLTHSDCFSFSTLIPSWEKLVYSFPSFHGLNVLNISTIASITILMSLDPNYSACWLQLIVFLFSKEHIYSSFPWMWSWIPEISCCEYFLQIFFIVTLECSKNFLEVFFNLFLICY